MDRPREALALLRAAKEEDDDEAEEEHEEQEEDNDDDDNHGGGPSLRAADGIRQRRLERYDQGGRRLPRHQQVQQQRSPCCSRALLLGARWRVWATAGLALACALVLLYWGVSCGRELALLGALYLRGTSAYHVLDVGPEVDMNQGRRVASVARDGAEPASASKGGIRLAPAELVPRILHRMWKTDDPATMPLAWNATYLSCIRAHPPGQGGWELRLWSDQAIRDFIAAEYGWFLPEFDSYPRAIQRVDAARYFVLYHFGGVYVDLDVGCARSLEPLRHAVSAPGKGAMFPLTSPCGVSNDVIFSAPR